MNYDVERLNTLFDQLLEKPFLSPTVAINAIRVALNLHGILLPKLDCEVEIEGPNTPEALSILMSGQRLPTKPLDVEYLYKIEADVEGWYFYMCLNRNEEAGVYEAYAQIVDEDDVDALVWADIPQELADLYVDMDDASGETKYQKQVRHVGTGGFNGEV